ncbi:MAG: putative ABC transporter permease [Erysipelotrichaceae bacterium]|nr:putative ABC transporter permease [Erysipelotrichaceae bacterium]
MGLLTHSIYEIWASFLIYSFCGWLMETVLVSYKEKKFVNRGFLNGPFCPIYGVGMIGISLVCSPFLGNYLVLFLLGMMTATTVEYLTAWLLELLFDATWWDYSQKKFNIKGRVCLSVSLFWGILAVLFISFVQPAVFSFLSRISTIYLEYFFYLSLLIFMTDVIFSVVAAAKLTTRIKAMFEQMPDFRDLMQVAREVDYFGLFDFKESTFSFRSFLSTIKDTTTELKENLTTLLPIERFKELTENYFDKIEKTIRTFTSNYSSGENRLIKAFPNIKFKKIRQYLSDLDKKDDKNEQK